MRGGLTQRTALASVVVVVVVLAEFVVLFIAFRSLRAEERQDNRAVNVLATSHALEECVLDMSAGLRVYLVSGHPDQLRSYQAGLSGYPRQACRLDGLTTGNPELHARVTSINDAIAGYVQRWAAPIVRLSRSDLPAARRVFASSAAKRPVVAIRGQFVALYHQQQTLSNARRAGAAHAEALALGFGVAGLIAALLLIAGGRSPCSRRSSARCGGWPTPWVGCAGETSRPGCPSVAWLSSASWPWGSTPWPRSSSRPGTRWSSRTPSSRASRLSCSAC